MMQKSLRQSFILMLMSLGLIFTGVNAQAGVGVVVNIPVPVDREVMGPPGGYETCYMAPSGYFNGYYIRTHRVCEYSNSPHGGAWVAGYWQCPNYHRGYCGGPWMWNPNHWVQAGYGEYGVVWRNHGYGRHVSYNHGGYYHGRDGHYGHDGYYR
jgi:hypothetical protein